MNDDLQCEAEEGPASPLVVERNARHRAFWSGQEASLQRRLVDALMQAEFTEFWKLQQWAPKAKQETPYVIGARVEARQSEFRSLGAEVGRRSGRQQFAAKGEGQDA